MSHVVETCPDRADYADRFPRSPKQRVTKLRSDGDPPSNRPATLRTKRKETPFIKEPANYISSSVQSSLDSLSNLLPLELKLLLTAFVMRRGPEAVIHTIKYDERLHPLNPTEDQQSGYTNRLMARATGNVCERMAHLFLDGQIQDPNQLLLDLGSTTRISGALNRTGNPYIHPDGMLFDNMDTSEPRLTAVYEYKNNPEHPLARTQLAEQITSARQFFQVASGQSFPVRTTAYKVKNIWFREICVAENPQFVLVIPQDRQVPADLGEAVNVIHAPFTSELVGKIASICIKPLTILWYNV